MENVNHDLAVIGNGYWGTATAFEARKQGWDTILLDDNQPLASSRNAAAMIHMGVFESKTVKDRWPEDWTWRELEDSFCWLEENCGLKKTGETFLNLARPELGERERSDLFAMVSNDPLLGLFPVELAHIERLYETPDGWVIWSNKASLITARKVVIAAGYRTDDLLIASDLPPVGVTPLEGRGITFKSSKPPPTRPTAVMWAPYRKVYAREWGGLWRVGDTAGKQSTDCLLKVAESLAGEIRSLDWVGGFRPVTEQFHVREAAPGLVVTVGGWRVALGLAGLVAKRTLQLLGGES